MRLRRVILGAAALCGATAACNAILDLQSPPAGSDGGSPGDSTTGPGSDRGAPNNDSAQDSPADAEADAIGPAMCLALELDASAPADAVAPSATYTSLDAPGAWESYPLGASFTGGTFDGRFVYLAPLSAAVVRFDSQSDAGFSSAASWDKSTLGAIDPSIGGFHGAAYDGRYVYLAPFGAPPAEAGSLAVRYDTDGGFAPDSGAWSIFNTTTLLAGASGFAGATFDGRFIYLVPNTSSTGASGLVVRFDTTSDAGSVKADAGMSSAFSTPGSAWSTFDLTTKSAAANTYTGAVFDGAHVYLVPSTFNAIAARFSVDAGFNDASAWSTFPLQTLLVPGDWEFTGGGFDGRYVYLVPFSTGVVLRFDTHDSIGWAPPNGSIGGWSAFNLAPILPTDAGLGSDDAGLQRRYAGAAFDGRFLYLTPRNTTLLVRYDTYSTFTEPCAWQTFDLASLADAGLPIGDNAYYVGAVFDGQYVYLVPAESNVPALRFRAKTPSAMPNLPQFHGSFY